MVKVIFTMRLVTTAKVQILLRVNFLMYKMQSARKPPWLMGFYSELCWHLNLTFSGFKWTPFSASSFHGLLCHMSDPGGLWSTLRPLTSCFSPLSTICSETRPLHSGAKFFLTPHMSVHVVMAVVHLHVTLCRQVLCVTFGGSTISITSYISHVWRTQLDTG